MKTIYLCRHSLPDKTTNAANRHIPLSEEGKERAASFFSRLGLPDGVRVYSSTYLRAFETAAETGREVVQDERLIERITGEAYTMEIWGAQYVDETACGIGGESFSQVRARMNESMDWILQSMEDGDKAVVVSHGASICAYLQQFCEIEVTELEEKLRRICFQGKVILDGKFVRPSCFQIRFEEGVVDIEYYT